MGQYSDLIPTFYHCLKAGDLSDHPMCGRRGQKGNMRGLSGHLKGRQVVTDTLAIEIMCILRN